MNKNKKVKGNILISVLLVMVLAGFLIGWYFIYFKQAMFKHNMNVFITNLGIASATNSN